MITEIEREVTKMFTTEMLDEMFAEMCERDGYTTWWEAEEAWEGYEAEMVERGVPAEMAEEFFSAMAWEL